MALRTPLRISPHLYMTDTKGRPLDGGNIYFGEPNKDPELYPIDVYLDSESVTPISQPITTKGGFLFYGGNMREIFSSKAVYSVKVVDAVGREVLYIPNSTRWDYGVRADLLKPDGIAMVGGATAFINQKSSLSATSTDKSRPYIVKDEGGSVFMFNANNLSTEVAKDSSQVFFIPPYGQNGSLGAWQKTSGSVDASTTISVGNSGYFNTISSALLYLSKFSPLANKTDIKVTLMLEAGFVMTEQVYLKNVNLGWVTIKSVDPIVYVNSAAMSTDYFPLDAENIPAAFLISGGTGATIGTAFEADNAAYPVADGFDGIHVRDSGSILILANCGFSNAKRSNLRASISGSISAEGAYVDSKRRTSYGIYTKFGGYINFGGGTCLNSVRHNIRAQRDSFISAERSTSGGQIEGGSLYASSNSVISAPLCTINNAGELQTSTAIYAGTNGKVDASESVINGTSGTVAKAVNGGHIDLYDTKVSGIAYQGFEATAASISAHMMQVTDNSAGSDMFLMAFRGGHIFMSGVTAQYSSYGVYCDASTIIAPNCDFSKASVFGVYCTSSGKVSMQQGKLNQCERYAAEVKQGSVFDFDDGSAINCGLGGIYYSDGSIGNLKGADLSPQKSGYGVNIFGGCTINARGANANIDATFVNAVTADGVIFK